MTKDELRQKANDLPLAPGVYLMMDKTGKVIYVGKAKKLKNRVSQYFQDTASHNEKTRAMVSQVDHFDTIFVSTEFEALILENSLIKRHMPRYNILLKDDKGYPFVRLDADAAYPRFSLVGKTADDGAKYFGPFGGRRETRLAIEAVCGALRLPICTRQFPRDIGRERSRSTRSNRRARPEPMWSSSTRQAGCRSTKRWCRSWSASARRCGSSADITAS